MWIESDSTLVVNTINGNALANNKINPYATHILHLLGLLENWNLTHIFREGNRAADKMASLGLGVQCESIFVSPPIEVAHLLNDDANEVPQYRFPKP
ncbi:hypothetical protein QJS10_CPA07g01410 [Acorus calamus]|uniref:RNase H type-1 domain-containing protein n=1 Tax=Acorus calamus TaxID=4465 RepID=A0AAV9EIP3_ACOCL|nr:hypothetical protein QJS10_CPA07g01410 [Acorus calamus]